MSPGRLDQYTWRCYENDMQRGVSPEREEELLGCLWVKFAEISKLRDYMGSLAFGGYPMFQNLIVGGMDTDGNDVTNDVSVLCCKVTAELKLSQPSLSVRWHKHSARRMKLAAAEVARAGIGMPAYFNDEAIIPVLRNIGCSLAEARDYCEVGCVEPHVAGRMEGMYSAGFTNLCKVLETTIFNGVDPIRGKQIGLAVGEQFEDFTAFYDAYRTQQRYFMDLHAQSVNAVEFAHSALCPTPLVSCFVDDCIERGVDIRRGGAHYNYTSPNAVGLANLGGSGLLSDPAHHHRDPADLRLLPGGHCHGLHAAAAVHPDRAGRRHRSAAPRHDRHHDERHGLHDAAGGEQHLRCQHLHGPPDGPHQQGRAAVSGLLLCSPADRGVLPGTHYHVWVRKA